MIIIPLPLFEMKKNFFFSFLGGLGVHADVGVKCKHNCIKERRVLLKAILSSGH